MKIFLLSFLILASSQNQNFLVQQIEKYSAEFLGRSYSWSSLGEGSGADFDPNPRYRFDTFNCTTYVETVLGKSVARDFKDFEEIMDKIRYEDGVVGFLERNHFPSNDWIANNKKIGLVSDVTGKLFGPKTRQLKTVIDKQSWYQKVHGLEVKFPKEQTSIPYISGDDLIENPKLLDKIPSGVIFNDVRPNWDIKKDIGTDLDVSHQGILVRKDDGILYIRHAKSPSHGVVEEVFLEYLQDKKARVAEFGVNILAVHPPKRKLKK